jgi:hypothetical protein
MTNFFYRLGQSPALEMEETKVKSVVPDLLSERSEAESVGNPCLGVETRQNPLKHGHPAKFARAIPSPSREEWREPAGVGRVSRQG